MRILFSLALGLLLCAGAEDALGAASAYSQSYAILIRGAVAGTESVTEETAANGDLVATSEHDLLITDGMETKRMAFSTKMVLSKGGRTPVSYSYKYTAGDSGDFYEVVIKDAQATRFLNRSGRTSEVTVPFPPGTVILDFSVYHHYDYLVGKYDARPGGRQVFSDFVPLIGDVIPVALTFQGNADLQLGQKTVPVRNFLVDFVGIWTGALSVDRHGRLVRLWIPAQDLEVVRKDLLSRDVPSAADGSGDSSSQK
jgi:hypothetical protein